METIYKKFTRKYRLTVSKKVEDALLEMVNGYIQYLQLSLFILHENEDNPPKTKEELFKLLIKDERITLQSEELWESLSEDERESLLKIIRKEPVTEEDKEKAKYIWVTGYVQEDGGLFSPLFQAYVENLIVEKHTNNQSVHFSKKEHALFTLLEKHVNDICEREVIISEVWPEYSEVGISDWAIDRLVARVRTKLRQQKSKYEIKTIRTRGYQLLEK